MATSNEKSMSWLAVDVNALPKSFREAHKATMEIREQAAKATKDFEDKYRKAIADQVPEGKEVVFSWKFGKLSLAVADPRTKTSTGKTTTFVPK